MEIYSLDIPDIKIIKYQVNADSRGYLFEAANPILDAKLGIISFVQSNITESVFGSIRGLHYQRVYPQGKLIHVIKGTIQDVVLDLRPNSETFGETLEVLLDARHKEALWIPPGFAHGFETLTRKGSTVFYWMTEARRPALEMSIHPLDLDLNIPWYARNPIISDKDMNGELWSQCILDWKE